jgi:hypothetical protein
MAGQIVKAATVEKSTAKAVEKIDKMDVFKRLRINKDYGQSVVIINVADIVPYSAFMAVDQIFPKLGLMIKRQFGYLGYSWGYGAMHEIRYKDAYPVNDAPVSLHIYFQQDISESFLVENASKFQKIFNYLSREWMIYKGVIEEEF